MNSSRYKGSMVSWTTFIWRAHQYISTIHCCSVKWEFAKKGPSPSPADFLQGVSLIPICYKFIQRPRNLWSTELLHTYLLLSVTSFALKSQPRSMSDWKLLPYNIYTAIYSSYCWSESVVCETTFWMELLASVQSQLSSSYSVRHSLFQAVQTHTPYQLLTKAHSPEEVWLALLCPHCALWFQLWSACLRTKT